MRFWGLTGKSNFFIHYKSLILLCVIFIKWLNVVKTGFGQQLMTPFPFVRGYTRAKVARTELGVKEPKQLSVPVLGPRYDLTTYYLCWIIYLTSPKSKRQKCEVISAWALREISGSFGMMSQKKYRIPFYDNSIVKIYSWQMWKSRHTNP